LMSFIDNLGFCLFGISFAGFMLLYTITSMYLVYRKRGKEYSAYLKSASVPIALIAVYLLVQGLWGQFVWPLPGSYNILFYDPMIAFALILLSFSLAIRYNSRLEYAGFLGLLVGIMVIVYGFFGYGLGLTEEPIALFMLYLFYGVAGIFSYPVSLIADRLPGLQKKKAWMGWHVALFIFWIALFVASGIAAFIGIPAISAHLLSPP
jgi:putative membrane protein